MLKNISIDCLLPSSLDDPRSISWAEPKGKFPQCFFREVVTEVIEEGDDFFIRLQRVSTAHREFQLYTQSALS